MNKNENFTTSDLALAGVITLSFPLMGLDRKNPRRVFFIFGNDSEIYQLAEDFFNADIKVEPLAYFHAIKTLKARIYENNVIPKSN